MNAECRTPFGSVAQFIATGCDAALRIRHAAVEHPSIAQIQTACELDAVRVDAIAIDEHRRRARVEVNCVPEFALEVSCTPMGLFVEQPLGQLDFMRLATLGQQIRIADQRVGKRIEAGQLERLAPAACNRESRIGERIGNAQTRARDRALIVCMIDAHTGLRGQAEA